MRKLAIIPAKKYSKRLNLKNFKYFNNKPIYKYTLKNLEESNLFDEIHISSNIIIENKYQEFKRPNKLCKNNTTLLQVIHWTLNKFKDRGKLFDVVCLAYATSPLVDEYDFKKAYKLFEKSNKKFPLLTVCKFSPSINEAMKKEGKLIKMIDEKKFNIDSKKHDDYYFETASFIFYSTVPFYKTKFSKFRSYKKFVPYELPREKSVDINTLDDFKFVKKLSEIL